MIIIIIISLETNKTFIYILIHVYSYLLFDKNLFKLFENVFNLFKKFFFFNFNYFLYLQKT
jgi:hypothetical protein